MLNFVSIGAQKAATTWLYTMLLKHPKIQFPGGKEVHFWDLYHHQGIDWYKNIFADNNVINGDITPAYAILPIEKIKENYAAFPDLKIIFTLRNPIERSWSLAKMLLLRAKLVIDEVPDQWFIDSFNSAGSLSRSQYEISIKRWLSVYPKEQLLLARYESISQNPSVYLNNILHHIGLPSFYQSTDDCLYLKVHEGLPDNIRPTLKVYLLNMFKNDIESLAEYLDQDLKSWLR